MTQEGRNKKNKSKQWAKPLQLYFDLVQALKTENRVKGDVNFLHPCCRLVKVERAGANEVV